MDPTAVFGAPLLGAIYQLLVSSGWEAFKRWNSGRKKEIIPAPDSTPLKGRLDPLKMNEDFENMFEVYEDLELLRRSYTPSGPFDEDDAVLMTALLRLRGNLEMLFGQHITFRTETSRPASGTQVKVRVKVTHVDEKSDVIGVKGSAAPGERIDVDVEAEDVTNGSNVIGYKRDVHDG